MWIYIKMQFIAQYFCGNCYQDYLSIIENAFEIEIFCNISLLSLLINLMHPCWIKENNRTEHKPLNGGLCSVWSFC